MEHDKKPEDYREALGERIGYSAVDGLTPEQVAAVRRLGVDVDELRLAVTLLALDIRLVPIKPPRAGTGVTVNDERIDS